MKLHRLALFALLSLVTGLSAGQAAALDVPRPPGKVSADLSEPFLLQIRPGSRKPVLSMPPARTAMSQPGPMRAPARTARKVRPIDRKFLPQSVSYEGREQPGTIVIDTEARFLYLVQENGTAMRYGVGVGRPGFEWAGEHRITRKAEWPDWVPPEEMRQRVPNLPVSMKGGPDNPLGARALYLGSTLYRIHGSNEPWTIGQAVSSGCIRMRNEDVTDLYSRVKVGTRVIVL
jgi:lipoprotein-anchoring transpeptidase ErfK/SrfK